MFKKDIVRTTSLTTTIQAALAVLLFVLIAGCGGGGDDTPPVGSDPGTPPPPNQGETDPVLDPPDDDEPTDTYEGIGLSLIVGNNNQKTIDVWPSDGSQVAVRIARAAAAINSELTLASSHDSISLVKLENGETRLVLAPTPSIANQEFDAELTLRNADKNLEQSVPIKFKVLVPETLANSSLGPEGGVVASPNGAVGVRADPGQFPSPVNVRILSADSNNGSVQLRYEFRGDVTSETTSIDFINDRAQISRLTQSLSSKDSSPATLRESELKETDETYPINQLIQNYPGYFIQNGNRRLAQTKNLLNPLLRSSCHGQPQSAPRVCLNFKLDAAKLSSDRTSELIQAQRIAAQQSGKTIVPVLFVSGFSVGDTLGGGRSTWNDFPRLVSDLSDSQTEYVPFEFRWRTNASFRVAGSDLANAVNTINRITGQAPRIVAHSFGGLLIRTVLQGQALGHANFDQESVGSVVTLGTPHSGIFDRDTTVGNTQFPDGQDSWLFNACGQISCRQAGQRVTWDDDFDLTGLTDSGQTGEFMRLLAESPLPDGLQITVGIGLKREGGDNDRLDDGDGLISYRGQRFRPDASQGQRHLNCDSTHGGYVTEVVLGAESVDADGVPIQPGSLSDVRGYSHSGPGLEPLPFRPDSDLEFGAPHVSCTDIASCQHAAFTLVRDTIEGRATNCGEADDGGGGGGEVEQLRPVPVSYTDPHLVTIDGLGYDFQAVGEFVLARSTLPGFEVQSRQVQYGGPDSQVSVNAAFAFDVNGDQVAVLPAPPNDDLTVYVNGEPQSTSAPVNLANGGKLSFGRPIQINWPDGSVATILDRGRFLNLSLAISDPHAGQISGLLGNFDGDSQNDLLTSDGRDITPTPEANELYGAFADGWRITNETSLFQYFDGESTETFTNRLIPGEVVTVDSLDDATRQNATRICTEAGITDPALLQNCILDVALTGDESIANTLMQVQQDLPTEIVPSAVQGTIDMPTLQCESRIVNPVYNGEFFGALASGETGNGWQSSLQLRQCDSAVVGSLTMFNTATQSGQRNRVVGALDDGVIRLRVGSPIETVGQESCEQIELTISARDAGEFDFGLSGTWTASNCLGGEVVLIGGAIDASPFLDSWSGTVQRGDQSYPVVVELSWLATARGLTGNVEYPTLGCSGTLDSLGTFGGTAEFLEVLTSPGSCNVDGFVRLRFDGNGGTLNYQWFSRNGGRLISLDATGILSRVR